MERGAGAGEGEGQEEEAGDRETDQEGEATNRRAKRGLRQAGRSLATAPTAIHQVQRQNYVVISVPELPRKFFSSGKFCGQQRIFQPKAASSKKTYEK